MKIMTIVHDNPQEFDSQVNLLLDRGYILGRRGPEKVGEKAVKLYAEMILPDQPEQPDPLEALRIVRDFCEEMPTEKCLGECPMTPWCAMYAPGDISPADWMIPDEEVGR